MKTPFVAKEDVQRAWHVVDARDQVLGRLASRIAHVLQGKHKPDYTPHVDNGDFVIVLNAAQVKVTGRKLETKTYDRYSGYPGGRKVIPLAEMLRKKPEEVIRHAVRGMLPKSRLGRAMLKKLKVYAGSDHPHAAQRPEPLQL